jgi:hypothetical protein
VKIFPSERNSFLNLSASVLNFSGDEGKIFTFKPAQKSAGSAIKLNFPIPNGQVILGDLKSGGTKYYTLLKLCDSLGLLNHN